MKRLFPIGMCVLLLGCTQPSTPKVEKLPPEEVLSKAAKATQTLESAQFVMNGDFEAESGQTWSTVGTIRMDGIMQNAGEQMRFQTDVTATVNDNGSTSTIDGTMEVVVIAEDEVYMNIHSLLVQPSSSIFRPEVIGVIASRWWQLPPGDTAPGTGTVSPDPRLLHAQSQVVSVTKDRGTELISGREAYHFDVELDKEKLISYMQAVSKNSQEEFDAEQMRSSLEEVSTSGELWIDAETFHVLKIRWVLQSLELENEAIASASFSITFRNINEAPVILAPEGAQLFTSDVFFTLPSDQPFPTAPTPGQGMSPEAVDKLIEQMNSLQ